MAVQCSALNAEPTHENNDIQPMLCRVHLFWSVMEIYT
jgi:hypothetical protein